jgi:hypothetical protein
LHHWWRAHRLVIGARSFSVCWAATCSSCKLVRMASVAELRRCSKPAREGDLLRSIV